MKNCCKIIYQRGKVVEFKCGKKGAEPCGFFAYCERGEAKRNLVRCKHYRARPHGEKGTTAVCTCVDARVDAYTHWYEESDAIGKAANKQWRNK